MLIKPQQQAPALVNASAIYRNNFFSNLTAALSAVYPVVQRLVGADFFAHMAKQFIVSSASKSGDIQDYGAEFAQFIERYPPARELVYLADVARLEWLYHQAFHAADCAETATEAMLATSPHDYGRLRFELHPACRLLASVYPVRAIWLSNQPDATTDQVIDLSAGDDYLIIRRPVFEIEIVPVSHAGFRALEHIAAGENLESAVDAASAVEPDVDIQSFMALLLSPGVASACCVGVAA